MTLRPDSPIDLQLHTVHSDGTWTPEQLIDHLINEGFGAAAITDHDRPDVVASLQALAGEKDFLLLPAVEMSTDWRGEPVDILCYGFEVGGGALQTVAANLLERQRDNLRRVVASIAQKGYPLPDEAVLDILNQPCVQQPHSLVALVKQHGYHTPDQSAGKLLVGAGLEIMTTALAEVVEAAHRDGGVALIAHPGRGDGYVLFDEALLDQLRAEIPIDGFEAYYPLHSDAQTEMYKAYAAKHGLLTSSGSDSHSPDRPPIPYRAEWSRPLLERLGVTMG